MSRALFAGTVLTATVMIAAAAAQQQNGDDFRWTGQIARGKSIEIKGVNGPIKASAASGNQVEVLGHKHGRRSDPASVRFDVIQHDGNVTICAVYPTPVRYSGYTSRNYFRRSSGDDDNAGPNECKPGNEGRMNVNNNDVNVDFDIRVPEGVRLLAKTVNGSIEAASLKSDIDAVTVNGRIRMSTTGIAWADTVNGAIDASLGAAKWNEPLDFHTVNGGITVELPKGVAAEVRADTMNGEIDSDFPIKVTSSRHRGRRIVGSIGSGGKELHISTTNGGIRLRSMP